MDKRIKKALECYEKGSLKEALNTCESILKKDPTNEDALILEGKVLFELGNISEAKITWLINADYNKNSDAQMHLDNIEQYTKLKALYDESLKDIENKNFNEAIKKLLTCSEVSFNKRNVDKAMEECFAAKKNTNKTEIDTPTQSKPAVETNILNGLTTKINLQEIQEKLNQVNVSEIGEYKIQPSRKSLKVIGITVAGIIVVVLTFNATKNFDFKSLASKNETIAQEEAPVEEIPEPIVEETPTEEVAEPEVTEVIEFPTDEFNTALANDDETRLYDLLTSVEKDKLSEENLALYEKAEKFMKETGIYTIHDIAYDKFRVENYEGAASSFKKAFDFCEGTNYEGQITYMLAVSYDNAGNKEESNKYYEIYISKFPTGDYADDIAYSLAVNNKDSNLELAKKYANLIQSDYSSSMYNNENINSILAQ